MYDRLLNKNKENKHLVNVEEWWLVQSNKIAIYNKYLTVIIFVELILTFGNYCKWYYKLNFVSTAVGQAVTCAPVTQWARVRSLVGTGFLGEVSFEVFPHL